MRVIGESKKKKKKDIANEKRPTRLRVQSVKGSILERANMLISQGASLRKHGRQIDKANPGKGKD